MIKVTLFILLYPLIFKGLTRRIIDGSIIYNSARKLKILNFLIMPL